MIKLRSKNGKVYKLSADVMFVEICDEEGNLAAVAYMTEDREMRVVSPGDEEFANYIATYKPKVTMVIQA